MAASLLTSACTRCVASSPNRIISAASARAFTASAYLEAAPKKGGKAGTKPPKKQGQGFAKVRGDKKPGGSSGMGGSGSGALKARGGAFAVPPSLMGQAPDLSAVPEMFPEFVMSTNVGKASRYPSQAVAAFEAFGLPNNLAKEFLANGAPTSVVRESTVQVVNKLLVAAKKDGSKSSRDASYLISGSRGSGKSTVLLQAVSTALLDEWIVIYVPQAIQWINSSSTYAYNATDKTFHQPAISSHLLKAVLEVNGKKLNDIKLPEQVSIDSQTFEAGSSLKELVQFGAKNEDASVGVLEKMMEVLAGQKDHKVLVAIDDVQALFTTSAYRAPDFSLLESYALSAPRLMLDYISGRKVLSNGAILTALSLTSATNLPSAELYAALPTLPSTRPITPFEQLDENHYNHAKSLQILPVGDKLARGEAHGMFKLWKELGIVVRDSDEVFLGKFAESGGNVAQFARGLSTSMTV